jgi:hypothetical protein
VNGAWWDGNVGSKVFLGVCSGASADQRVVFDAN